jgi:hypothetical protein
MRKRIERSGTGFEDQSPLDVVAVLQRNITAIIGTGGRV